MDSTSGQPTSSYTRIDVATGESRAPRFNSFKDSYTFEPMDRIDIEMGTDGNPILPVPEVIKALQAIEKLDVNWDSYGSNAPTALAVTAARSLIWTVDLESMYKDRKRPVPRAVLPLSGGGVQIEWQGEASAIEVEVSSEGIFGYLLAKGRGPSREFTEADDVPRARIVELVLSITE